MLVCGVPVTGILTLILSFIAAIFAVQSLAAVVPVRKKEGTVDDEKIKPQPHYLTAAQLLAAYEAAGQGRSARALLLDIAAGTVGAASARAAPEGGEMSRKVSGDLADHQIIHVTRLAAHQIFLGWWVVVGAIDRRAKGAPPWTIRSIPPPARSNSAPCSTIPI